MTASALATTLGDRSRAWLTPARLRALQAGLMVAGLLFAGVYLVILAGGQGFLDAHAYWSARLDHLYVAGFVGERDAFLYSPAFAQVLAPLTGVPFPAFATAWAALELAGLLWLLWPLPLGWRIPLLLLASPELVSGNIHVFIAIAIVVGFRCPASWAFVLLTKVTPGIGLLWFAVRREWRPLATALLATVAVVAVSFALTPSLWADWLGVLAGNAASGAGASALAVPLWLRLPIALVVAVWGARSDRRWTVPVAATLAVPALYLHTLTILYASVRLARPDGLSRDELGALSRPTPQRTAL